MEVPGNLFYTPTDEWVRVEGDEVVVGITDYAQSELGDIVYVELPEVGRYLQQEEPFGAIESVKAASDLYAPVEGEVVDANHGLAAALENINSAPYTDGWFLRIRVKDKSQLDSLMNAEQYKQYRQIE